LCDGKSTIRPVLESTSARWTNHRKGRLSSVNPSVPATFLSCTRRAQSRANRLAFPSAVSLDRFRLAREDRRERLVLADTPRFVSRARHTPGSGSVETHCVRSRPRRRPVRHKRSGPKRETPERLVAPTNSTVLQGRDLTSQRTRARPLPGATRPHGPARNSRFPTLPHSWRLAGPPAAGLGASRPCAVGRPCGPPGWSPASRQAARG
jgi:hypothetical protein